MHQWLSVSLNLLNSVKVLLHLGKNSISTNHPSTHPPKIGLLKAKGVFPDISHPKLMTKLTLKSQQNHKGCFSSCNRNNVRSTFITVFCHRLLASLALRVVRSISIDIG